MTIFTTIPHNKFPEHYDICQNTGACFYKKAEIREYSSSYFMEEFQAQYKKTYYEDEPNLRNLAKSRLSILQKFQEPNQKKLLEIGCAAGFFLSEASKLGYIVEGIEISEGEAEYARKSLGLNVKKSSFFDYDTPEKFDVVCAFFVLEHFFEQEKAILKIFSLLKEGGFLFLALPSLYGPTFQTNPDEWFKTHPTDHFVDYSPSSLKKLFSGLNARIVYNAPMSYHPGRDLGWRGKFPIKILYKVIANISCYGDTIQVLAKKN